MINTKYLYFHILKELACENCGSDLSLSWYTSKPTDRWNQYDKDYKLTIRMFIIKFSFLLILKV